MLAGPPAGAQPQSTPFSGTCPNGAPAREARYCSFFVHYNTGDAPLQTMVADFLGVSQASQTRSIGLIIAIDSYPNMPGHDLSAAAVDAQRLQDFLIDNQHFDEVIVLRNADATVENINYFLEDYLPNHADDYKGADGQGKARLLIAYTGHGRQQTPNVQAAFILSSASDPNGSSDIYKMTDFTGDVANLAGHYFHVLTLINACFGANFFTNGNTGAAGTPTAPGSFAITAGSPRDEVQALIPSRGSLFFDLIVNSISRGEADPESDQYYVTTGDGSVQLQGSLTLSLALENYLTGAFYRINAIQKKADPNFLTISAPFFGPVQSGMAQGGFFFISNLPADHQLASIDPYLEPLAPGSHVETASAAAPDIAAPPVPRHHAFIARGASHAEVASAATADRAAAPGPRLHPFGAALGHFDATSNLRGVSLDPMTASAVRTSPNLPVGPISSLKGRPDIKIFKPPVIYPIRGYDFSSADGTIDWTAFANGRLPNFVYARALGWSGPDTTFADRWSHAKALGIDRGAYVKFNYCLSVEDQLEQFRRQVTLDADALPVGVELVTPTADQPGGAAQLQCYLGIGAPEAQDRILRLAQAVEGLSGKTPILLGNSYDLSVLTDARADRYMLWLDAYGPPSAIGSKLKLSGANPWTIWQYSGSLNVPGVGDGVTGEVFFGTAAQYADFRHATTNVALAAVKP
jgi:lysozyme